MADPSQFKINEYYNLSVILKLLDLGELQGIRVSDLCEKLWLLILI